MMLQGSYLGRVLMYSTACISRHLHGKWKCDRITDKGVPGGEKRIFECNVMQMACDQVLKKLISEKLIFFFFFKQAIFFTWAHSKSIRWPGSTVTNKYLRVASGHITL